MIDQETVEMVKLLSTTIFLIMSICCIYYIIKLFSKLIKQIFVIFFDAWISTSSKNNEEELESHRWQIRFISFGLACFVMPSAITSTFNTIVTFLIELLRQLPKSLLRSWENGLSYCSNSQTSKCVGYIFFNFFQGLTSTLYNTTQISYLKSFPISTLIIFITLWLLIFLLIKSKENPFTLINKILDYILTYKETRHRNWVLFYSLLAIALYLSIASIIAVPGLKDEIKPSDNLTSEKLKQQLDNILSEFNRSPENEKNTQHKNFDKENPFELIENAIQQIKNSSIVTPEKDKFTYISSEIENHKYRCILLLETHNKAKIKIESLLSSSKSSALSTYEVNNVGRKGNREQAQHFLAIQEWFRGTTRELDNKLNNFNKSVERMDNYWRELSKIMASSLSSPLTQTDSQFQRFIYDHYNEIIEKMNSNINIFEKPLRMSLGSNLGPFSILASWLLRTESLALALIVGLIGFGLLCSTCSTFIRRLSLDNASFQFVEHLPGIVIRGLTAAIVVFLVVEGGLAILGSSNSEPNPYVLLFVCFSSSVFSEDVWDWAHQRLKDTLKRQDDTT